MSKKKTRKRIIKAPTPRVDTVFDCLFCSHKRSVEAKNRKEKRAEIKCKSCGASYKMNINHLTRPIDVYSQWIDESEKINKEEKENQEVVEDES